MAKFMDLGPLAESRNRNPKAPIDIDEAELCRRFAATYTGAVNDVLREFMLMDQALPHPIKPLLPTMRVAGIAFTIRSSRDPGVDLDGEMAERAKMLEAIPANAVCVWDTNSEDVAAHWGGMMTAAVKKRGVLGAVIDGGIRDTDQILAEDFPIFHRYRSSNGMLGRSRISAYQVPVVIGGVMIFPGDVIVADIDGAIVVPRGVASDVLRRTEKIIAFEGDIKSWVDAGNSATEIVRKGGYF